jgi:hypothetical protein
MNKRKKSRKFSWQINASSVAALLGKNKFQNPEEALAKTWQMNLKRMPKFGVTPSYSPNKQTTEQIVTQQIEKKHAKTIAKAIDRKVDQRTAVAEMKTHAVKEVEQTQQQVEHAHQALSKAKQTHELVQYPKISSGLRSTRKQGYFCVEERIYHKTGSKSAKKCSMQEANDHGWYVDKKAVVEKAVKKEKVAVEQASLAKKVAATIEKQAKKSINTQRGTKKEASDLEILQRTVPNVKAGNDRSYFLNVSRGDGAYGAFVIGRIDGIDQNTDTIYELKSRSSRLFHRVCEYEEIQCMIYAKMLRKDKVVLVETYRGEQLLYPMRFENGVFGPSNLVWKNVQSQLEQVVLNLNRIEEDEEFRQKIINILF